MATRKKAEPEKPRLERMSLLKSVLQGYRVRLDEELQPLGITTAQLRMLWTVASNTGVSGAEIARLCSVTPQTGQALLAKMEAHGWIKRHPSAESERVLVAELTVSGRRVLSRAREMAERLDHDLWADVDEHDLHVLDQVLGKAVSRLVR